LEEIAMCKEVAILRADGSADYVCNKGEIEERMGGPVPGVENSQENGCLCPMDEEATAKLYGYALSVGWDSHGVDLVMTPNVQLTGRPQGSPSATAG
jgi:hypothetical protein